MAAVHRRHLLIGMLGLCVGYEIRWISQPPSIFAVWVHRHRVLRWAVSQRGYGSSNDSGLRKRGCAKHTTDVCAQDLCYNLCVRVFLIVVVKGAANRREALVAFANILGFVALSPTCDNSMGLVPPGHIPQTPADDNCLPHSLLAGKDSIAFAQGRKVNGWPVGDPGRIAANSLKAKTLRTKIAAVALSSGNKDASDRLMQLGRDGWMDEKDFKYYAQKRGVDILITEPCSRIEP